MSAKIEYRCFVGGLAWATTDQILHEAFSQYGEIIDSKIIKDRETGRRSRGFGFVTLGNEKAMRDAIEGMNGTDLDGRNITVTDLQSREVVEEVRDIWVTEMREMKVKGKGLIPVIKTRVGSFVFIAVKRVI